MPSAIHSVLFKNSIWSKLQARKWLADHELKPIKPVHESEYFHRYRIKDPSLFDSFITKKLKNGIDIVIGFYQR